MTAKITRLRIAGFKSFADPATIDILPGLTGIVGPNGCGKSNVVEALRWAMGESSARALRGGELDDLIFAGTGARPARSLAEVTLWLDDASGLAPPPFAEVDGLEICRRAERGSGSEFRLNSRALRARDITTLFADLSSGARSSSIVSQNRVSALISAKPEERRSLLEEAAGITGIHARRHDAELKLRQAEVNMERSDDLRQQIENRLALLEAQSAQARSYRSLSEAIREDERSLTYLIHLRAEALIVQTEAQLVIAQREHQEAAASADHAKAEGETRKSLLANLRERADASRMQRDRLVLLRETAEANRDRARSTITALADRLAQTESDAQLAHNRIGETRSHGKTLEDEIAALNSLLSQLPESLEKAQNAAAQHASQLSEAETHRQNAAGRLVEARMEAQSRQTEHDAVVSRFETLQHDYETLSQELQALREELPNSEAIRSHEEALQTALRLQSEARLHNDALSRMVQEQRLTLARSEQLHEQGIQDSLRVTREETRLKQRIAHLASLADKTGNELEALRTCRLSAEALERLNDVVETIKIEASALRNESGQHRKVLTEFEQIALKAEAEYRMIEQQCDLIAKDIAQGEDTRTRLAQRLQDLLAEREKLKQEKPDKTQIAAIKGKRQDAQQHVEALRAGLAEHEKRHTALRDEQTNLENDTRIAATELIHLRARHEALSDRRGEETLPDPVIEALTVPEELGRAVAALLSEAIEASLDDGAARVWRVLPGLTDQSLPLPAQPLNQLIDPPLALARLFAHSALVTSHSEGDALQPSLRPGQCLVARNGALWRWDGYRESGDLPSRALISLQRQSERRELTARITECETILAPMQERLAAVEQEARSILETMTHLKQDLQRHDKTLIQSAQEETRIQFLQEQCLARLNHIDKIHLEAERECAAIDHRIAEAHDALAALPDLSNLMQGASDARARCDRARTEEKRSLEQASAADMRYREARDDASSAYLQDRADSEREIALSEEVTRTQQELAALTKDFNALGVSELTTRQTELKRAVSTARVALDQSQNDQLMAREALSTCEQEANQTHHALQQLKTTKLRLQSRIEALTPQEISLSRALEAAREALATLQPVPELAPAEQAFEQANALESRLRREYDSFLDRHRNLDAELIRTEQSRDALALRKTETARLLTNQSQDLDRALSRVEEARHEHENAVEALQKFYDAVGTETTALSEAETDCQTAFAELNTCEMALNALEAMRDQDARRAVAARETAIRLQERLDQAHVQRGKLQTERPADLPQTLDIPLTEQSETELRRRLARTVKERESLGAVNLLAESEYEEARSQSDHLTREHDELTSAIQRLRSSINELKKEGRERLQAVFVEVDGHFQSLFSRMFSGGRAHLGLVGSDDPLEAGLELFAQPPGKKLTTLSLLSGGEQALTALSLIFATFRCHPAPLCILDEVDAPLDDANVERLCGLLRDMTGESGTRFLIVTHHQLTMAHMDRLFGITMQERGVSQVLSVDLQRAASFVENGALPVAS